MPPFAESFSARSPSLTPSPPVQPDTYPPADRHSVPPTTNNKTTSMANAPVFQPMYRAPLVYNTETPTHYPSGIPGSFVPSPPIVQSTPVMSTVLVPDIVNGGFLEVTGMLKAGSVDVPLIAHTSTGLETTVPQSRQENVPFQDQAPFAQVAPVSSFAPRASMFERHMSNESSGSDNWGKPDATHMDILRGRAQAISVAPLSRPALSPVRQGENVQAKLQSRLNNSLLDRAGGSSSPRR